MALPGSLGHADVRAAPGHRPAGHGHHDAAADTRLLRNLIADPTTVITRGSTYENRANLAGAFLEQIVKKYEGTRLGRQELNAELLDDVPGALWTRALIEAARPPMGFVLPDLVRVVVAIDPAASSGEDADETGIIVAGKDKEGRGYVLADLSGHYTPTEWARIAVRRLQEPRCRPDRRRDQ